MLQIPKATTFVVPFAAYLDTDHLTPATGKTIAITISKTSGSTMAAFGNPSAGATNATEVSSGAYYVVLSTTDTGTAGGIMIRGTHADIDDVLIVAQIVDGAAFLNALVEGTLTVQQHMKLVGAATHNVSTGLDTANPKYRDYANTVDRMSLTATVDGNRSAFTYNFT